MRTTVARRLSIVLLVAAAAGVALAIGTALAAVAALDRDARALAERTTRLHAALDDVEEAQAGFLESGSVTTALLEQTAARLRAIQADALQLTRDLRTTGASPAVTTLVEATDALGTTVTRGHDNLTAGRDLMAADLLLSGTEDARRTVGRTARALQAAESSASREARTTALVWAWAVFSVAALAGAVLLLVRARAARSVGVTPVGLLAAEAPPDREEKAEAVPASAPAPAPIDLEATAELCTAIGRMATAAELPDLLARTGTNLGASGVVVWMAVGDALAPVASHGYDEGRFPALGSVDLSDGNATAAAWRTARAQIVPAGHGTRGAIVVPMHRPDRCVGVLAVELDDGREHDATTRAVAGILAAQFAAVLSAEPAGVGALSA